ncbi:error-prone DNA polymerase [Vibrio tapetis]|uniref:Error-prone DNA polymerase n=1 Tax=Vibrio tapetis subsp. tapetis TaxID=1671868 RepID=A0A2N8ZCW1_9VIBR|nr:error-prone DNA polymerase [Vibrio tapetis]SON49740.1 Error-prone DNA polymerase [Vibrio tapetis subsp. tapetis]
MQYAELFCQSNFSFLEGASHAEELAIQADFLRYSGIAITDECSVAGVVRAHTAIRDHQLKVKLIVGSLFRLGSELEVILLCPTREAYAELCRVITNARRRSPKGEYALSDWDLMSVKHCLILWLPSHKPSDHEWGKWLGQHHAHRLWIGLQRHLQSDDADYLAHCQQLSREYSLPITACGGVLMHNANRLPLQHVLTALKHGTSIERSGKRLLSNTERTLRSKEKLNKLFRTEWLEESVHILERCKFNLDQLRYEYPSELVPDGFNAMSYLRHLVGKGCLFRFPNGVPAHVQSIIDKELTLIEELNYAFFFLTIHDIVMFAKAQGILYQGRGSAANSVVCYCLEITSVDPRQISVLFERFISKERNEPPDIDVDFEHERREEVIQYIYAKYGRERAALAATVISYRFKSAIRDVGKALGIAETQLNFFIKNINRREGRNSWQAQIVELGLDPNTSKGQQFIALVEEIMGFPRHLSQHVGGFVISSGPLYELVPVENATMSDRTVIQWDKDDLESLGLLKVDVLALGMLTAIRKCFHSIQHHHGRSLSIADITRMQDDKNVYNMLQKADTVGVFQIESRAQMSMLPRLKPATYYDLVIQIAIVRPGPIQGDMVHPFLKRRNGEEPISYPSEEVKDVLSRTMGVPIFQEQVIKLAMVAAGFSGGEADQLRRAMASWKKNGQLMQFKSKLINGMQDRGYETAYAERIFDQICGFGEYGFPESHSASFAVLAYTSAWLKYYYPEAFYTALLNSHPMGFYSCSQLVQDAKRHGIRILPICVNHSRYEHQVINEQGDFLIRLGFRLIKGFSHDGAKMLVQRRPETGYRHSGELKRVGLNRRDIELLASADALKILAGDRFSARWAVMDNLNDLPLFRDIEPSNDQHQYTPDEFSTLNEDYASTGLSLNKHPITLLDAAGKLGRFTRMTELMTMPHKSLVTVTGVVTGKQSPGTAAGVTFVTLEDDTGNINVVVWAGTAKAQKQAYLTAKILQVKGILEREGEVTHVIAGKLIDLTDNAATLMTKSRDFH